MVGMADGTSETELGRLLQLAGHEIRSPLSALNGYLGMVVKGQFGALNESQERILKDVQRSSGRIKEVLDEISLLAKIERGEEPFKPVEVELGALIEEAIADLPEQRDRTVTIEVQLNGPVHLRADRTRLKLAISALCFALRRELVATHRLIVRIERNDGEVVIGIAGDDAVDGLLARDRERDLPGFDEFTNRGGCGLKLPIARRTIEQHAGRLYGAGPQNKATAIVHLPLT